MTKYERCDECDKWTDELKIDRFKITGNVAFACCKYCSEKVRGEKNVNSS